MCNVIKSTTNDGCVVCTHCHNTTWCLLMHMDVVYVDATHGVFEHV